MQSGGSDTASAGRYNDAVVNSLYDNGGIYSNKTMPHVSQNYTQLFNINLFKQDLLSQSLKKDIINKNLLNKVA
ncbi:MAG: hypothetical protein PHX65_07645 [Sulfurimonas sp.]|jgi:hypothetical protein|nr:hypothetical protein [Sulfurimonas sp.]